jgi:putative transposase
MRVEPYVVGSYVHVLKRGARGMPLTRDEKDRWRFVRLLYHMNDSYKDEYWERQTADLSIFERPEQWPERRPIVSLLAWTLMPNHFHLILKEITPGGVAKFVQKFSNSMSSHFNQKYDEKGSLFQGSYKSRTITEDRYLQWLTSYVMVKNVFELYPGGLERAAKEFDSAWEWGQAKYQFSSLPDFVHGRNFPII